MQMRVRRERRQHTQEEAGAGPARTASVERTEKTATWALSLSQSPKYSCEGALEALRAALKSAHW